MAEGIQKFLKYHYQVISLFGMLLFLSLWIYKDFNISVDEPLHRYYGESIVNYYLTLGKDKSFHDLFTLKYYGPLFDMSSNIFFRLFPRLGVYETMHLLCSIFSLIGLFYLYKIARYWFRDYFALILIPIVFFSPFYFNSSFNQPKDIPFSSLFIASIYFLIRYSRILPRFNRKTLVYLSIFVGLTNAVRTLGVLLYLIGILILIYNIYKYRKNSFIIKSLFKQSILIFLISFAVMTIFFPYMHKAPLRNYIETIIVFSKYPHSMDYLFLGKIYNSLDTPRLYIPVHLIIKSPEYLLVGLLPIIWILVLYIGKFRLTINVKELKIFMFLFGFYALLVSILIIIKPVLYEPRQFLFLYPILYILSIFSYRYIYKSNFYGKLVTIIILLLGFSYSVYINIIYHPSQMSFFNILVTKPLEPNPYFYTHVSNTQNKIKLLQAKLQSDTSQKDRIFTIFDPEENNWKNDLETLGLDISILENFKKQIKFPINLRTEDKSYYLPENIILTSDKNIADFLFDEDQQYLKFFKTEVAVSELRGKLEFSKIYRIVR